MDRRRGSITCSSTTNRRRIPGEPDFSKPGPAFIQIASEGGVLPEPVVLNNPPMQIPTECDGSVNPDGPFNLLMAPAERADLIIDFSSVPVGSNLILYNDAPAPFPMGDPRNDYYTGCPDQTATGGAPSTQPGMGANTRTLMQFRVVKLTGAADPMDFQSTLDALSEALPVAYRDSHEPFGEFDLDPAAPDVKYEIKTLNEDFDEYGRLIQRLGTDQAKYGDSYGRNYMDDPTEVYHEGETVVWDIYNTTGDTHPMHFHLVNVQVLGRATFDDSIPNLLTFQPDSCLPAAGSELPRLEGDSAHEPGRSHPRDHEVRSAVGPRVQRSAAVRAPACPRAPTNTYGIATSWSTKSTT